MIATRPSYMPKFRSQAYKPLSDTGFDTNDDLTIAETDITLDAQDVGAAVMPVGTIIRIENEYMDVSGNDAANPSVLTVVRGAHSSTAAIHATNADIYKIVKSECVLYLEGQQDAQSATIRDLSGKANHGTITGATWVRLPSGLWVNSYDGTDDVIDGGTAASLNFNNTSFTWMGWITKGTYTVRRMLCGKNWDGNSEMYIHVTSNVAIQAQIQSPAGQNINPIGIMAENSGYHFIVFTLDRSILTGTLYIDSILAQAVQTLGFGTGLNVTNWYIGHDGSAIDKWLGNIGLFRIFNRALSATEIAGIYQSERHLFNV